VFRLKPLEVIVINSPLNLSLAEADGYAAYGEDRPAAPILSPVVYAIVEGAAVGTGAVDVFAAFQRGYSKAADEAAAAFLAELGI
jgi:hypothetical protein